MWRLFSFCCARGGDGVVLGIGVGMIDSGRWDIVGHRVSSKRAVPGGEDVGIVGA